MIWEVLYILIIVGYFLSLGWITLFSFGQLNLAIHYLKSRKKQKQTILISDWPAVTIQLPIYNEKYVVDRLLEAVAKMDYPTGKLSVQILDDSTDETTQLIASKIEALKDSKVTFEHIRRPDRIGYKAGALAYGLSQTPDQFIAIFDADFVPPTDFLKKTLPHFHTEKIGMVQTRWGHINENYSLLTQMQAFGLNAHFSVEQVGRLKSGSFINFNGTGGIWRKACIEEAGGWQHDTLTEDLDLSYRAQLAGWQFEFVEDIECPAELPVMVPAIKSQQYRWNKGAAESARKHLGTILKAGLSFPVKLRATMHLLNSSVFFALLVAATLSIPMLYIKDIMPSLGIWFDIGTVFVLGFMAIGFFYWAATASMSSARSRRSYYLKNFPLFMIFSMGLALHNSIAILEGFIGKKTPFIRTPKFNVVASSDSWQANTYIRSIQSITPSTWIEALLSLYFLFGAFYGLYIEDFGLLLWHIMLSIGFGIVSLLSFKATSHASA